VNTSTIIFPIPIEIMGAISALTTHLGGDPHPPIIPPAPAVDETDLGSSVEATNALPDVVIPPLDIPEPDLPTAPPDLPPPPTAPPPPPTA